MMGFCSGIKFDPEGYKELLLRKDSETDQRLMIGVLVESEDMGSQPGNEKGDPSTTSVSELCGSAM